MAQIKQIGIGRKSSGTIDGITYYTLNGKTFARSTPNMPASVYNTTEARIRQSIFKFVQLHMKLHLRTIRQTITAKNGTPCNRYYKLNKKGLYAALQPLAEQYVEGANITINDVEEAISAYAAENPTSIIIASRSGFKEVFLTGDWPATITLNALTGDSTVIIIVNEKGVTTTFNPDGSTVVVQGSNSSASGSSGSTSTGSGTSGSQSGGSDTGNGGGSSTSSLHAPTLSGATQFEESTQVSMSAESGAEIHYTLDGSTPSVSSTLYSAPVTLTETTTVKAIAIKDGVSSSVASRTFTKGTGGEGEDES